MQELRNTGFINSINEENPRHIEGYAVVFNSRSELLYGTFYEEIRSDAITQELVDNCDVFALMNHDGDKVLARSNKGKGSLKLTVDERGLKYEFDAPNTALGDELLEHIRRNEIDKSSFAFRLADDEAHNTWDLRGDDLYRTIYKIDYLHDVSPVYSPAYQETSVEQKSIDKYASIKQRLLEERNKQLEAEKREAEEEQSKKEQELMTMYDDMLAELEKL